MGKLTFYYGTMNASKTTNLLMSAYAYGDKALIIKPSIDDREGKQTGWGTIESRVLKSSMPCYYTDKIAGEVVEIVKNKQIVFVDEVQFFDSLDIFALHEIVDLYNKDVVCYGLKTNSDSKLFEAASVLFAVADEHKEIERPCECEGCNNKAVTHIRYVDGLPVFRNKTIAIDKGNVSYKSVCRKCFKNVFFKTICNLEIEE